MAEENVFRVRLSLKGRPLKAYTFTKDVITAGRDPDADIFLDNASISREHLRFERMPNGHYSVTDQGSANGTFLNDERVQEAVLYHNDVVRIGKFSLWISLERDRRGADNQAARKASSDSAVGTVMLSSNEMDTMISVAREREIVAPVVFEEPVLADAGSRHSSRVPMILTIGLALILATSLGAGAAWLLIK